MKHISRWLAVVILLLAPSVTLTAESVSTLPAPTGYVNDFAGVLSPAVKQNLESLCTQVDRQAYVPATVKAAPPPEPAPARSERPAPVVETTADEAGVEEETAEQAVATEAVRVPPVEELEVAVSDQVQVAHR